MNSARTSGPSCAETVPASVPRGPHVYFARQDDAVKIGFSGNVAKRLAGLQTGHHSQIVLLGFVPASGGTEKEYHDRFAHLHIRGEWFKAEPELLEALDAECSKPQEPLRPDYWSLFKDFQKQSRRTPPGDTRLIFAQTRVGFFLRMLANGETPERLAGLREATDNLESAIS